MKTAKLMSVVVVVACALVIIAFMPSTLTDPLVKALAEIRQNTMRSATPSAPYVNGVSLPSQESGTEPKSN
jgi:hypothetical protein